ncbi:MAG TPA: hypothetical protein VID24_02200 [Candidatus Eremiobacteraceae bacterium]
MLSLLVPTVQAPPPLDASHGAAAWPVTTTISLPWNVAHARTATDATAVSVLTDGKYLYVRFDAVQHEPIIAAQHSDDVVTGGSNIGGGIAWSDDAVWVDLWPTGPGGFQYQFEAGPNGSHNEASSENTAFAPHWESHGWTTSSGYTVTMAIPLAVVHGAHAGVWRMEFARYVRSTGELDVWSYDATQTSPDDVARAGNVTVPLVVRPPLPSPRIGLYGLDRVASGSAGGSGSHFGGDFSVPVTQTASVFGTIHPDFSNVELDQQSISPTVYARVFGEVRPFFTQSAGYYNNFNCDVCGGFHTTLYTPAIPTPLDGYAFEGRQGLFGLAGFDSIGSGRTDAAGALNYTSDDTHWNGAFQHVSTDLPGIVDDSNEAGMAWFNGKNLSAYANYATESGTLVTDASQANWIDAGTGWGSQTFALFGAVRKLGNQFNPVDGFDSHPGIAGYALYSARVWSFAPQDVLSSAGVSVFGDRYQGVTDGQAQSDNSALLDILTKNTIDIQFSSGSDYWRFGTGPTSVLAPISQSGGVSITYHSGMQNNLNNFPTHGASSTPTSIQWYTGRYGIGTLDTWFRNSTLKVGSRGSLTFTVDDTAQWMPQGIDDNVQWFDGAAYAYQVSSSSSFAVGLRRVIGIAPLPNGGGNCLGECSNVSIAYHLRTRDEEFYLAYGDPNSLVTTPQAILKVIFYIGGQKGT